MTDLGVPVFNTPGANANAVKELALCGLFLASRGVMEGATRMEELHQSWRSARADRERKAQFGGRELAGKTLGVVGLGAIGAAVLKAALDLRMEVVGFDPRSVSMRLSNYRATASASSIRLEDLAKASDYISLHAPSNEHDERDDLDADIEPDAPRCVYS